jgi:hypothetical protein
MSNITPALAVRATSQASVCAFNFSAGAAVAFGLVTVPFWSRHRSKDVVCGPEDSFKDAVDEGSDSEKEGNRNASKRGPLDGKNVQLNPTVVSSGPNPRPA